MNQKLTAKLLLVIGIIVLFGYLFYPTIRFNLMSRADKERLEINDPDNYDKLQKQSIKLGLDLQGGMHVVLEVNVKELLLKLAHNKDAVFEKALNDAVAELANNEGDLIYTFDRKIQEMGKDIALYYGTKDRRSRKEILEYLYSQAEESINRSLEILRNRIDQFGVAEPSIQKQGDHRIIVELAGITDRKRALDLIGKTAKLEFRLLKEPQVAQRVAQRINEYLQGQAPEVDSKTAKADTASESPEDTSVVRPEELFGVAESQKPDSQKADSAALATVSQRINEPIFIPTARGIFVREIDIARFQALKEDPEYQKIITQETGGAEFLLGKEDPGARKEAVENRYVPVYLVNLNSELTGETIVDASPRRGSMDDPSSAGRWETLLTFNNEGARDFARVTGANIGKPLAIILDGRVHSTPNIQTKIRGGNARITGLETSEEARDLSIVLKAGALPAPLEIIEERTVGPSLGKDSVNKGYQSALMGLALVALFMIVYYKFSGFVANIALVLNILILLGFMSALHATLTLPGIAGIILTIGMAVDANVLIFERMREELDKGKSMWVSIDTGYGRAFVTILDANVTTFIAAIVLYNFGSGPVRGFATTLMIGIIASMFTAIFVTRTIFEFLLSKRILKGISI